ncbi:MAG: HAMP domain-containing histidine kinase [Lachnospiraceae bacterium]|nr:HAMP domain-containing histidine kinase [Lachnospiraceae bacterium]
MSTKEIQKLRQKFILVAMFSFFLVMLFIGIVIVTISYTTTNFSIHSTLEKITKSGGKLQELDMDEPEFHPTFPSFIEAFSPTYQHNHFFLLQYDGQGELSEFTSSSSSNYENTLIKTYARYVLGLSKEYGRYGTYYYLKTPAPGNGLKLAVMDCTSELTSMLRIFSATAMTCFVALLITFVLVLILSDHMVQPEIENSKRQKQFITNASHELKTPLAVIRANTELMELTHGEDEWTKSTLKQVDHLNSLIQNLVLIAKAAEREDKSVMVEINASNAVEESVANFDALAKQSDKELRREIEKDLSIITDESKLRQLTTLLVDNAIKYCDENGTITVALSGIKKGKKGLRLSVSNTYAEGANIDCNRFFDRFYREDASHNIDKGGYGIGLSIAESICKQNGGSIHASWKDGIITFTCLLI